MCSQRAKLISLKAKPPIRLAMITATAKPIMSGHFTVVNGFMRFPFFFVYASDPGSPTPWVQPPRGSCTAAAWKNRGLTPIIQRCPALPLASPVNIAFWGHTGPARAAIVGLRNMINLETVEYERYRTDQEPAIGFARGALHEGHARFSAMRVFGTDGGCAQSLYGEFCACEHIRGPGS